MSGARTSWNRIGFAIVLALSVAVGAPGSSDAREPIRLPAAAVELLPPSPLAVGAVHSLGELERNVEDLVRAFDPAAADSVDVLTSLSGWLGDIRSYTDPTLPAAFAVVTPAGAAVPFVVIVVPLADADVTPETFTERTGVAVSEISGGYASIATSPGYTPDATAGPSVIDLPPGHIVLRIDVKRLYELYGPMLDLALASIPSRPADPDAPDGAGAPDPAAQAAVFADLFREFLGSIRTFEMALTPTATMSELAFAIDAVPGSPLDPGPQPSFADARRLAGYLPETDDAVFISAVSFATMTDMIRKLYEAAFAANPELPPRVRALYEKQLDLLDLWWWPMAGTFKVSESGMTATMLMKADEPDRERDRLVDFLSSLGEYGLTFTPSASEPTRLSGWPVQTYTLAVDPEALLEGSDADADAAEVAGTAAQVLAELIPPIHITSGSGLVIMVADRDPSRLATILTAVNEGRESLPAAARLGLDWAGDGIDQLASFDLGRLMSGFGGILQSQHPEASGLDQLPSTPILALTDVHGSRSAYRIGVDANRLATLVKALEGWEESVKRTEAKD